VSQLFKLEGNIGGSWELNPNTCCLRGGAVCGDARRLGIAAARCPAPGPGRGFAGGL